MSERKKISSDDYAELIARFPEKRTPDFGDATTNRIMGILIAYSKRYDMRDGWIDILTTQDAEEEIKQLIKDCGGSLNAL